MKVLLDHPFILRSVERLQGVNFIPTWDSMVIKMPNEGIIVPWHRETSVPSGAVHAKPIFNVDFYLDPSDLRTCLWVIPGSNKWSEKEAYERCKRDEDFDISDAVPVPLIAGDVIFHDITVLHGSPSGDGNDLRRTVYYEFREAEVERSSGPISPPIFRLSSKYCSLVLSEEPRKLICKRKSSLLIRRQEVLQLAKSRNRSRTEFRMASTGGNSRSSRLKCEGYFFRASI